MGAVRFNWEVNKSASCSPALFQPITEVASVLLSNGSKQIFYWWGQSLHGHLSPSATEMLLMRTVDTLDFIQVGMLA